MRARLWLSVAALVAGLGLLTAAALAGPPPRKGGTLRISEPFDVGSIDPALAYRTETFGVIEFATCAKLYNYPDNPAPAGAIVIPEVAKGFPKVSKDGKTQTIELRPTYRFHTGRRITAANFVAAFNRDASPKLQSPATAYLHEIVGADAVIDGKARTIAGVRALSPYRLQIRTNRPLGDLVSRLTMPFFCPIATTTPLQEIDDPLGSGPYYVAARIPDRQIVLKRNRFYHGRRPAKVDQVVWTIGAGPEACRPAVKGPGQSPLKQAINWALDRRALVGAVGFLGGKRTDQILPPTMTRAASIYPLGPVTEPRLVTARALLAKARVKPKRLVLYAPSDRPLPFPAWAQIFQFNLKRLGIDVEIKYFPFGVVAEKAGIRGEPFDVAILAWSVDYADPITFFGPLLNGNNLTPTGNLNLAHFDRPKYNREIERIDRLTGVARRRAWAELDVEMMRNDPPWAPFMNGAQRDFVSKSFGCYLFQPVIGDFDIAAACKK